MQSGSQKNFIRSEENKSSSSAIVEEKENEVDEIFEKLCLSDSETDYESESETSKNDKLRDKLKKNGQFSLM